MVNLEEKNRKYSSYFEHFKDFPHIFNDKHLWGFPDSSVGNESACNAGDPTLSPGSERSSGEGIGYPLQYSLASLVAQLVKNLPATWETWVQPLGWGDPLEKGKATHSSILASPGPPFVDCLVQGVTKSWTGLSNFHFHFVIMYLFVWASQVALVVKSLPANAGDVRRPGLSLNQEDPLEEGMATHSSILAWRISWTEEPGKGTSSDLF